MMAGHKLTIAAVMVGYAWSKSIASPFKARATLTHPTNAEIRTSFVGWVSVGPWRWRESMHLIRRVTHHGPSVSDDGGSRADDRRRNGGLRVEQVNCLLL